ncbi:hypothetical protein TSMEX_001429 [Taenia solium]|eukprot:TsM_000556400 transcript=TsM_000556400 gene=TsM_000556400
MNEGVAYIVGMEEQKYCKSNKDQQCSITDVLPLTPYNICVRNCRREVAIAKPASSSIKGAHLESSDTPEVPTIFNTDQYTYSSAVCDDIIIRMEASRIANLTAKDLTAVTVEYRKSNDYNLSELIFAYIKGWEEKYYASDFGLKGIITDLLPCIPYTVCVRA